MESKNIKIVDEHGIDRNANIIFAIDVDGSDYVVYWIERDTDNDNIFVSKLLKNIDGTSSMINIDDVNEKEKMDDMVKELIKYAIDNEDNKLSNNSLTLPSGKTVVISSVLFNKEQNINVQKTYITTVKKAVTKVSKDYYDIVVTEPKTVSVVEPVVQPVSEAVPNVETPVIFPEQPEPVLVEPMVEPVSSVIPPVIEPQGADLGTAGPVAPVEPVISNIEVPEVTPVTPLNVNPISVNPIKPEVGISQPVIEPVMVEPSPINLDSRINVVEGPKVPEVTPLEQPVVAPVIPPIESAPTMIEPKVEPIASVPTASKLVFDASKESNLNQALGEASKETTIPVENIQPVREFGIEEPTPVKNISTQSATTNVGETVITENTINQKAGFANNKFFMVVAIAFFLASCVFLGYEVFNYFQVK